MDVVEERDEHHVTDAEYMEMGTNTCQTGELNMNEVEERDEVNAITHAHGMQPSEIHSFELERDDIKLGRLLGSGTFGEVYEATMADNIVAVKCLKGKIIPIALPLKEWQPGLRPTLVFLFLFIIIISFIVVVVFSTIIVIVIVVVVVVIVVVVVVVVVVLLLLLIIIIIIIIIIQK